jgi:putative tricarboxylic transport membrane protein
MRAPSGQVAVSAGVTALGVVILWGSFYLPTGGGYAQVGPGVVPRFVGIILVILGAALLREAFTGGYRGVDEEAEVHLPMDWVAFAWITGGIILYGLLVERLGFILASIALYVMVARSFNSRRWVLNAVVGAGLAIFIFVTFNYGLGLNLPMGVFQKLLT